MRGSSARRPSYPRTSAALFALLQQRLQDAVTDRGRAVVFEGMV